MKAILCYLNALSPDEQMAFAARCETTVGYLRKAVCTQQRLGVELCMKLDRESSGAICCEVIRPDIDWEWLRNRACVGASNQDESPARIAQAAIESVAQGAAHG